MKRRERVPILWPITDPHTPLAGLPYSLRFAEGAWKANKTQNSIMYTEDPSVRPEPCPIWEAVKGAFALASVVLALAVIVGGIWALGW